MATIIFRVLCFGSLPIIGNGAEFIIKNILLPNYKIQQKNKVLIITI